MSYIQEPGLEGTTGLAPDLRVDFPLGSVGTLGFGFALSATASSPNLKVTFRVYDSGGTLLGSVTQLADYTQPSPPTNSSFPEALVSLPFAGTAAYATFDFDSTDAARYILDNFNGTFGSTERPPLQAKQVPMMVELGVTIMSLLLAGLGAFWLRGRARMYS